VANYLLNGLFLFLARKRPAILSLFILSGIIPTGSQTLVKSTVTDIDGHTYQTVVIGFYEWMAENLKTTTYNNGIPIPDVPENNAWAGSDSGAYCWYSNKKGNAPVYGALYNWYAVNTGNLCPAGWRVPTDEEWKYLEGYIDTCYGIGNPLWDNEGSRGEVAGLRLKADTGWNGDRNGSNDMGFSALPGGERLSDGRFLTIGSNGFWWSSTESDSAYAWYRCLFFSDDRIIRNIHPKAMGFSVRCIRDL